jgi:hypothetical protein
MWVMSALQLPEPPVAVWVGNLSAAATEERLRNFFEERFGAAVMGVTMLPCAAGAPRAAIVDFQWISEGRKAAEALSETRAAAVPWIVGRAPSVEAQMVRT